MILQSTKVAKNPHDKVRNRTPNFINRRIDKKCESIFQAAVLKGPEAVIKRLNQLDKEWDIDKALICLFSGTVAAQVGASMKKKNDIFLWGPLVQSSFLLLYVTYGLSPSMLILRQLGFRTRFEIQDEREELLNVLEILEQEKFEENLSVTEWDLYETV